MVLGGLGGFLGDNIMYKALCPAQSKGPKMAVIMQLFGYTAFPGFLFHEDMTLSPQQNDTSWVCSGFCVHQLFSYPCSP